MFETQSLIILLQVTFCISLFGGSLWTLGINLTLNSLPIVRVTWWEFKKKKKVSEYCKISIFLLNIKTLFSI